MVWLTRKRAAVLVAATLVLLLTAVPARVIGYLLPATLQLGGFSGTLWQGQAARATVVSADKLIHLGRVSWQLAPWSLLILSPSIDLNARWGQQRLQGNVQVGPGGGVTLRNIDASADAQVIREFMPLFIGGTIEAQVPFLSIESLTPPRIDRVDGRVIWSNGVWTARSGDVALGNYVLEINGQQGSLVGALQTLSGPLKVEGQLNLEGPQYRVDVALRGPATNNEGLRNSLRLMATPTADGFDLKLNGQL